MYFTTKQFMHYVNQPSLYDLRASLRASFRTVLPAAQAGQTLLSKEEARTIMREAHSALAARDTRLSHYGLYKWFRPWDVVPALRDIEAPEGDFTVGVEIEMGFRTVEDASFVAQKVIRWKNVTLDLEGGAIPIEATFPPILYSKFDDKCQAVRYVNILSENEGRLHHRGVQVGTHVNVGARGGVSFPRIDRINDQIRALPNTLLQRYFGRRPYGYGYVQGGNRWVEWKLFDSTNDVQRFKSYVHIAVALTALSKSEEAITRTSVHNALEQGYLLAYPDGTTARATTLHSNVA